MAVPVLDPQIAEVLRKQAEAGLLPIEEIPPDEQRANYEKVCKEQFGPVDELHSVEDMEADGVPALARDDGRERATDTVSSDADPVRIDPELLGVRDHPLRGRPAVVERRRIVVLRSEPVVHRDDDALGPAGERARDPVVRVEAADHIAAAVEVDESPLRLGRVRGLVHPHGNALGVHVLDRVHLVDRPERLVDDPHVVRAVLLGRERLDRRRARLFCQTEDVDDLRVEIGD